MLKLHYRGACGGVRHAHSFRQSARAEHFTTRRPHTRTPYPQNDYASAPLSDYAHVFNATTTNMTSSYVVSVHNKGNNNICFYVISF